MRRPPPRSTHFPYTTLFRSPTVERLGRVPIAGRLPLTVADVTRAVGLDPDLAPLVLLDRESRGLLIDWHDLGNQEDRKSTRLNSSHANISYAVFCLTKKNLQ